MGGRQGQMRDLQGRRTRRDPTRGHRQIRVESLGGESPGNSSGMEANAGHGQRTSRRATSAEPRAGLRDELTANPCLFLHLLRAGSREKGAAYLPRGRQTDRRWKETDRRTSLHAACDLQGIQERGTCLR